MRLRRIEVDSFRAFGSASFDVPESGVVLVAGVNNAGKSALLSAIDILAFGNQYPEQQNYRSGRESRMTATFRLDSGEREALLYSSSDPALANSDCLRDVTWELSGNAGQLSIGELRTHWPNRGEIVIARATPAGGTLRVEVNQAQAVLAGQSGQEFGLIETGSVSGDPNVLRSAVQLGLFGPLAGFCNTWAAGLYHFRALRPGTSGDTYPGRAEQRLSPTGENLPAVRNSLYHNRRELYESLKERIKKIVPGIGELHLPLEGDQIRIVFTDPDVPNARLNLKSLGTGVEQLLMTLVVGLMEEGPSAVIIEEPETNLHPGAQRALLALIREWSSTRPYILATHSPVFLNASYRTDVLLVTRQSGESHVRSLGTRSLEALHELGVQLSDVLSADRLLLLEGPSDEGVLSVWFPEHMTNPRLAVIHAPGGDGARYAHHLQAWLSQADRLGDRRVLYLRDRDELPEHEAREDRRRQGGTWSRTGELSARRGCTHHSRSGTKKR